MTTRTGSAPLRGSFDRAGISELGLPALVSLEGPDARRFCNGMFTNNVRDLPVGGAHRSALVDDRGRLFGLLDVICTGPDTFLAVLDGIDAESFLARFEKFVVFDDVTLTDRTGSLRAVTVQGPEAERVLAQAGLPVPAAGRSEVVGPVRVLRSGRSPTGGFDLLAPSGHPLGLSASALDPFALELLRVAAGRVRYPDDTGDKGLPHELGLRDQVLHFEKGCYIGQESINRIDVMGQVRRALAGVLTEAGAPPPGAEVRVDGQKVGALSSPVALPDGSGLALAILRKPSDAPGSRVEVVAGDDRWDGRVVSLPHPV